MMTRIHDVFESQVRRQPDALAVLHGNECLTYEDLNVRANQLANHLQSHGIQPETRVAIFLERSVDALVAILAVLKSGGAYVPFDPELPKERIDHILRDSGSPILITKKLLENRLPTHNSLVVRLDEESDEILRASKHNPVSRSTPESLAYVIYTSGSTGRPKGVMIPHAGVPNMVSAQKEILGINETSRILQFYSFAFDASVFEVFMAILSGATLIIESRDLLMNGIQLEELIRIKKITNIQLPPGVLSLLSNENLPDLRTVLIGGEVYPVNVVTRWAASHQVFNVYGPTECTVWSTVGRVVTAGDVRRIGRPIPNVHVAILDDRLKPVSPGTIGELCIGGRGVGLGYLNDPTQTAEKFIPDPYSHTGGKLYRTGDLAKCLPDGVIEFHGRSDHQVKVRGFRIELGEIEAVLSTYPGVREVAAAIKKDHSDESIITAYIVPSTTDQQNLDIKDLARFSRERLPLYMVPNAFVIMDVLPKTPNDKIDRNALPPPMRGQILSPSSSARTPLEEQLCRIWEEVLGIDRIGVDNDFFELGGHSLKAAQITGKLRERFDIDIRLSEFFAASVIRAQARQIILKVLNKAEGPAESDPRFGNTQFASQDDLCWVDPDLKGRIDSLAPPRRSFFISTITGSVRNDLSAVQVASPSPRYRLSLSQQRLWVLSQTAPESAAYNIAFAYTIQETLNIDALRKAFHIILCRHEILRSRFIGDEIEIIPPCDGDPRFTLHILHLEGAPGLRRETLSRIKEEEARRPFNLSDGPLIRAFLFSVSEEHYELFFVVHHLIFDGWSTNLLSRELSLFYKALIEQPDLLPDPLPLHYQDFSSWQHSFAKSTSFRDQLEYWKKNLADAPPKINLPVDRLPAAKRTNRGARQEITLNGLLVRNVRQVATACKTTVFSVLFSAFAMLLHRYSGEADSDLVIGTVSAGRARQQFENIIGFFVNTLPIRMTLSDQHSFYETLDQINKALLDAQDHQDVPFDKIIEQTRIRNPHEGLSPFLQVMFVFQNMGFSQLRLGETRAIINDVHNGTAKFDLELQLIEHEEEIAGWFEYSAELFDSETISSFGSQFLTLIQALIENPTVPIGALPLLSKRERDTILIEWNRTAVPYPQDRLIHHYIEECAKQIPNSTAAVFEGQSLTYDALNRRANQIAQRLRRMGVGPDCLVAVMMDRSLELVVSLLGVLKAGGAYVPIDPDYPRDRRIFMMKDCGARVALTQPYLEKELDVDIPHRISVTRDFSDFISEPQENPAVEVSPHHLAYVIYTSGSTGVPKGAMNTHAGILNRLLWMQDQYPLTPNDAVLQKTPYSFDVSVWEFFWPLMAGSKLVVARPGGHRDNNYLARLISYEQITTIHFVPSMLRLFLEDPSVTKCSTLKRVICSGEELSADLLRRFYHVLKAEIHNLYGPTEAAIDVTYWKCSLRDAEWAVPIGRPIHNMQVYVLNRHLQPVPVGAIGELYLGGVGIGRGYLGQPDLTAERFIPNPFASKPGERLYRTGDLARYRRDGSLVFLGRADTQIKLNGLRIELGEIEAVIRGNSDVRDAIVIPSEVTPGIKRIIAYIVLADNLLNRSGSAVIHGLREYLRARLPEYMIPSIFNIVQTIPLTPSGKVDRRALAELAHGVPEKQTTNNFDSAKERKVASLWNEVLGLSSIGPEDNFFESGGHSLLATKLVMKLREAFDVELPVRSLFEAPTVRAITRIIHALKTDAAGVIESESMVDLEAEAILDPEIIPNHENPPKQKMEAVFLTGGTGFLGSFLAREILNQTQAQVYCLVRSRDEASGMRRIKEMMERYGIWRDEFCARIVAIPGDLSQPMFGLSSSYFDYLARRVDRIYHNGAWVNFIEPYYRLKGPNVDSTREVIRLACQSHTKSLHYISSSSVYGTIGYFTGRRILREDDDITLGLGFHYGGYVKSKWVAERMIWHAFSRGLSGSIFRCALVLGDSKTGVANTLDFPSRLIKGCIQLGAFYRLRNKYDNFVPVDFASRAIVHLSLKPELHGRAFHIVNPHHIEYSEFWKMISSLGYPMEELDYNSWRERFLAHARRFEDNPLYPLLPLFIEGVPPTRRTIVELFQDVPVYDTSNMQKGLAGSGIECPAINERLVRIWMDYYMTSGFIDKPVGLKV
jgi:amino acid adenylation domain-containing protein/thioester reductase-like protein